MKTLVNLNSSSDFRTMEELFDRVFGAPSPTPITTLPVDVTEQNGNLLITAAVPGIDPNELEVSIEKNVLTIRGENKLTNESAETRVYRREIRYGHFSRSVRLPEGLNLNEVDAEFRNGLVTIKLPRLPEEKPLAVRINVRNTEPTPEPNA